MFILKPKVKSKDFKGDHHPPLTLKVIKTLNNFVKTKFIQLFSNNLCIFQRIEIEIKRSLYMKS